MRGVKAEMSKSGGKRLVCCVNGSEHATKAVILACTLSLSMDRGLTFVLVNHLRPASGYPPLRAWSANEVRRIVDTAVSYARSRGVSDVETEVIEATDVVEAIIAYARDHDVDHIVMGIGNPPFIGQLLIGSVAEAVVSRAPCSVTVAR